MSVTESTNSYVSNSYANTYFNGALHADAWNCAGSTLQDKALITATRMLDRQLWKGSKTVISQALEWPRLGIVDKSGTSLSSSLVPADIKNAQCELALALLDDISIQAQGSGGSKVKSMATGSVALVFQSNTGDKSILPEIVMQLVGRYASSDTVGVGYAGGVDEESVLGTPYDILRSF